VTGYAVTESATAPVAGWSASPKTSYTFASGGQSRSGKLGQWHKWCELLYTNDSKGEQQPWQRDQDGTTEQYSKLRWQALVELSERFQVHLNQITEWKKQLLERASEIFDREKKDAGPDVKELHAKIGQLAMENDFLSVALGRIDGPSARK